MRPLAAASDRKRRFFMVFIAGELLLAMAIPFVAIRGYHTLLDSRAGNLIEEPTRADPGWRALVDATTVIGVAEVDQDAVSGVTVLIHHPELRTASTVVLVPGSVVIDGIALSERQPDDAVQAVGRAIRLAVGRAEVLDDVGWAAVLGEHRLTVESPDPVIGADGAPLFDVGPVSVDGSNAAAFLGRPAPNAAPISVLPRRHLFWNAIVVDPPSTSTPLAADIGEMDRTRTQVVDLPLSGDDPTVIDGAATESLIRDIVAFPAGAVPGDRLQVRVLDRTGTADLEDIAAAIAARGLEVIEIGNAGVFDNGRTEVIAPIALTENESALRSELDDLSLSVGASSVILDEETEELSVVTVVVGADFDLANLY